MRRVFQEFITDVGKNIHRRDYQDNEKAIILQYMKNKGELCGAAGYVDDIVAGTATRIVNGGFCDGQYEWSSQEIYHIEKYNAAVTDDFLNHVLSSTI